MRNEELRAISDQMLTMLDRLVAMERDKQELTLGSDEFVRLAEEVDHLSRMVQAWAATQLAEARDAEAKRGRGELGDVRLVDVKPRQLDRILADWREAELRHATAEPGSIAARQAEEDVSRLRDEYHRADQGKRGG